MLFTVRSFGAKLLDDESILNQGLLLDNLRSLRNGSYLIPLLLLVVLGMMTLPVPPFLLAQKLLSAKIWRKSAEVGPGALDLTVGRIRRGESDSGVPWSIVGIKRETEKPPRRLICRLV